MNRKDNELLRVAKQNLNNEQQKYKDKHLMDVTDPREDYMEMDQDEDYIKEQEKRLTF